MYGALMLFFMAPLIVMSGVPCIMDRLITHKTTAMDTLMLMCGLLVVASVIVTVIETGVLGLPPQM